MAIQIRHAIEADLQALTDLYNHYIEHTPITFDLQPKSLAERQQWYAQFDASSPHQLYVAVDNRQVIGYAGSSRFRDKAAYGTSIETTIYLHPDATGAGVGIRLYQALFEALRGFDLHRAYAGITQPNEASVALHRKLGFKPIGVYAEVGRKFDHYWDVAWFEKALD